MPGHHSPRTETAMTRHSTTGVLLDLDGTLVDSVYHHVLAWDHALASHDHEVPLERIHRAIGLGSDRLLPWLLGGEPENADAIAALHTERFLDMAERLRPTSGARALIEDLERRGVGFVIATSAGDDERAVLLSALGTDEVPTVGSDDVSSSKPSPDLLSAAADQLAGEPQHLIMVGDSPWDARAVERAGIAAIGVRTGGFCAESLAGAGASRVVDAPLDLVGTL